ncbi:MAG: extracellular solute-binding protein family 3, partial [Frondihabitans sp.]|nr:extracellular solute-binding protein family 3 [Frondihabitans sp.]
MPRRLLAVAAAAVAITVVALTGCSATSTSSSASSGSSSTVTIATDANYPPCESYKSGTKDMVGFEPDLWNAIAKKSGQTVKVVNTDFDSLIPGVQSGRYDVAMECISDSAAREKQVSFLDFIYAEDAVITTAKYTGSIDDTDPLSVCGQTMGAQTGFDVITTVEDSINPACVKAGKSKVTVQTYPSAAATYNALYSGRVDFVIQDT